MDGKLAFGGWSGILIMVIYGLIMLSIAILRIGATGMLKKVTRNTTWVVKV